MTYIHFSEKAPAVTPEYCERLNSIIKIVLETPDLINLMLDMEYAIDSGHAGMMRQKAADICEALTYA